MKQKNGGKPTVFGGRPFLNEGKRRMRGRVRNPEYKPREFSDEELKKLRTIDIPLSEDEETKMRTRYAKKDRVYIDSLYCAYELVRILASYKVTRDNYKDSRKSLSALVAMLEIQV